MGKLLVALMLIAGFIVGVGGCVLNIVKLIMAFVHGDPITTFLIGRIVGVFVPIIGAVLGWF